MYEMQYISSYNDLLVMQYQMIIILIKMTIIIIIIQMTMTIIIVQGAAVVTKIVTSSLSLLLNYI